MFHHPQYWRTRIPRSLFEQTLYETDQVFYATFPAARDAAYNVDLGQSYDCPRYTNCSTLHEDPQPLEYDIRSEQEMDISSLSVLTPSGPTQELSCPPLHYDYSKVHAQQAPPSLYQHQPSYYFSPPPIKNEVPVYIPSDRLYNQQHPHSSKSTSLYISGPQSPPSPGPDHVYIQESIDDGRSRESPSDGFRQLNRHMKPPTLNFTNNCQLAVMRLDRLGEDSQIDSLKHGDQLYASSSSTPPTEFLLNSAKSPSIGLSSLPSNNLPERKPPLACLFCRGRKIACGPPLPGSIRKTCNQCRKRSLQCHYPSESRRGMRKKKPLNSSNTTASAATKITKKTKSHS